MHFQGYITWVHTIMALQKGNIGFRSQQILSPSTSNLISDEAVMVEYLSKIEF